MANTSFLKNRLYSETSVTLRYATAVIKRTPSYGMPVDFTVINMPKYTTHVPGSNWSKFQVLIVQAILEQGGKMQPIFLILIWAHMDPNGR